VGCPTLNGLLRTSWSRLRFAYSTRSGASPILRRRFAAIGRFSWATAARQALVEVFGSTNSSRSEKVQIPESEIRLFDLSRNPIRCDRHEALSGLWLLTGQMSPETASRHSESYLPENNHADVRRSVIKRRGQPTCPPDWLSCYRPEAVVPKALVRALTGGGALHAFRGTGAARRG
jgi:hypothetical protein